MTIIETAATVAIETIVKKSIEKLFSPNSSTNDPKNKISETNNEIKIKLISHLKNTERWSRNTSLPGSVEQKRISQIFLELDTFVIPLTQLFSDSSESSPVRGEKNIFRAPSNSTKPLLSTLTESPEHCVILGQAGSGKTTSIKKICCDFFNKQKVLRNYNFPILIRFREITQAPENIPLGNLFYKIATETGLISLIKETESKQPKDTNAAQEIICKRLNNLKCAILLDGFDEISAALNRDSIIVEVDFLSSRLTETKIITTSRAPDFRFHPQNTKIVELAPLTSDQITYFADRWFKNPHDSEIFKEKLFKSPFSDTAGRPLTLAHLCAIFEYTGHIPDKPKSVYKRIVRLLLEDWDATRNIKRCSRYANFDVDQKEDFLSALSFHLSAKYKATRFNSLLLKEIYLEICDDFNLPRTESEQVAREIESHSGLIIESGNRTFEFSHKSLQEYFSAHFIVRLPTPWDDWQEELLNMPNEAAIAVTLSSNSTKYFTNLVLKLLLPKKASKSYLTTFLYRLNLEKTDLTYSESAIIAACAIIEQVDHPANLEVFIEMMRGVYLLTINSYYREIGDNDEHVSYLLQKSLPGNIYPTKLKIPKYVHSKFKKLPPKTHFDE